MKRKASPIFWLSTTSAFSRFSFRNRAFLTRITFPKKPRSWSACKEIRELVPRDRLIATANFSCRSDSYLGVSVQLILRLYVCLCK
jgi:hypothetical protein